MTHPAQHLDSNRASDHRTHRGNRMGTKEKTDATNNDNNRCATMSIDDALTFVRVAKRHFALLACDNDARIRAVAFSVYILASPSARRCYRIWREEEEEDDGSREIADFINRVGEKWWTLGGDGGGVPSLFRLAGVEIVRSFGAEFLLSLSRDYVLREDTRALLESIVARNLSVYLGEKEDLEKS